MSALGQERTLAALVFMSDLPPTTDIISRKTDIGDSMFAFGVRAYVTRLRDVGVREGDLPAMAEKATVMQFLLDNNPRDMTEADILDIYQAAY